MVIDQIIRESVQNLPPESYTGTTRGLYMIGARRDQLAPYGSKLLDVQLRGLAQDIHGSLFMGARADLAKRVTSTAWTLTGNNRANRFQELLQNAEWGAGWRVFMQKVVRAYTTFNFGAVVEIIGAGSSDTPITGQVMGLKTLDPLRCYATGNPEHPILYENFWLDSANERQVSYHLMHWTRVYRIVDMPDDDEKLLGYGESALYRYISHHWRQRLMNRYAVEKLSDQPPAGLMLVNNIAPGMFEEAQTQYEYDRAADGQTVWRNVFTLEGHDPKEPITVEFVPFAQTPDGFDYETYMATDVRMVALALGVDPQDIWPLSGNFSGTAGQSKVLQEKARGKTLGVLYAVIEQMINTRVLPPSLEFKFKPMDVENDVAQATRAQAWVSVANDAPIPDEAKLKLLANTVDEIKDVVTDDAGQLIDFSDVDVVEDPQPIAVEDEAILDDTTEPGAGDDQTLDDTEQGETTKDLPDTRAQFIRSLTDTFRAYQSGSMDRRRFGTVTRALLSKWGRKAMMDGLSDGGVSVDVLEGDDAAAFNTWLVEQSAYVTDVGEAIRDGAAFDPAKRALLWANKSINSIYQSGLLSADRNGMYEWGLGATEEHCRTCKAADGQIHRLKDWQNAGVMPQTSALECGGWNCKCKLTRKPAGTRSKGRLSRIPR